jgi:nucleotide-binding universal stress UspA family protein
VIVASIGLSMGALTPNLYTMIVTMAVVTTLAMPPMLRWALARLPLGEDERARLQREAVASRGFVPRLERLLVAVDDTAKGAFALRLTGLLAGSQGTPVTILPFGSSSPSPGPRPLALERAAPIVRAAARGIAAPPANPVGSTPAKVDVRARVVEGPIEAAVASEARKGYDLLVVGLEPTVGPEGGFADAVTQVANGFAGALAIVAARGVHLDQPLAAELRILVPITGTELSRRGAEVALALARAARAPVTALHVASGAAKSARRRGFGRLRRDESIVKDMAGLAEHYGVPIRTAVRVDLAAEDAILRQARLGGHNLIVMGVTRRPGDRLSFGNVAAAVLDSSERSVLYVAT